MICPHCNTEIADNSKFCKMCGAPQKPVEALCKTCGTPIAKGKPFCPKCGASQKEVSALCQRCNKPIPLNSPFCPGCGAQQKWTMTTCRKCNRPMKTESELCPYCGVSQREVTSPCPRCGNQIGPEEFFCQFCGAQLKESAPDKSKGIMGAKKRGAFLTIWLILIIIFSALGISFGLKLIHLRGIHYSIRWVRCAILIISAISIISAIAVFRQKKWGAVGLIISWLAAAALLYIMHFSLYWLTACFIGFLILLFFLLPKWKYF